MRCKILLSSNTSWSIVNFRSGLIRALVKEGCDVVVACPVDTYTERLARLGCRHIPLAMDNKGTNPFRDAVLFLRYLRLMRRERPNVFFGWTIKPNVYGSLAARGLTIPAINNIAGLGVAFSRQGWLNRTVKLLYRVALARSACVFFQNPDDRGLFLRSGLAHAAQARLLPGSGVDLVRFAPAFSVPSEDGPVFILIARMLWDKGVGEYVEAARQVRARVPRARFRLLGFLDVENRSAIPRKTMESWVREGIAEYLGVTDDVRPHIAAADCVVLPSYYPEGTPRSLLEGAAMGRPLITTDTPGCRTVVDDGINGWLCKARDAGDLTGKMMRFVELSQEQRAEMGRQSRLKAEREFDERLVIKSCLEAVRQAVPKAG
ncbi:glycosyltransferase family 4 protein [Manganibacter manganicus]|uniref:Glycosyl transferase n=1 Tax=Manganibacter manganicus TaxID=1873176 RepID=A0A1V8RWS4_9HYPH|nr:glycosyltransferase family 4 protein [Pseudaminobacter manganicus]OQM77584.1 glycosyl transferase [Pseudaminobacter manganicus]